MWKGKFQPFKDNLEVLATLVKVHVGNWKNRELSIIRDW
jgi:hypothetical protein